MSSKWREVKLKDICEFKYGKNLPASKRRPGPYNVYGSSDIAGTHDEYLVEGPGVIIGRKGTVGKIQYSKEPFFPIDTTFYLDIDHEQSNLLFLYYCLSLIGFEDMNSDAAVPGLNRTAAINCKINLPPLPIQQKIATILSAYDDLIENNLKRIELLEEQAQLIYEEWFVRMKFPGHESAVIDSKTGLPEGWGEISLSKIAKINAKSIPSSFDDYISYIDISCVSTRSIDDKVNYHIDDAPGRAKRVLSHGDIIWSCVRPNRKSYAVVWKPEKNTIASTGFAVITPNKVPTSFLYQVLGNDHFVGYLNNRAMGAAYPAVKAIDFKQYIVKLPPKSLIDSFDNQVKDSLELIWNLNRQNQLLKEARDILLPRLMTGVIEV